MQALPVGTRFRTCLSHEPAALIEPGRPCRDYWVGHAIGDDGLPRYYAIVKRSLIEEQADAPVVGLRA